MSETTDEVACISEMFLTGNGTLWINLCITVNNEAPLHEGNDEPFYRRECARG